MAEDEGPEWVVKTQTTLGELIKRPKLTEALLQKPPFRFLHDVVSEVTKVTGFASGLYQEDELNSGKIKDKDSKLAYLSKIIKCVELALGIEIPIRVGKVVAGLEAENTNLFLQYLYEAATTVPDSSVAVSQVLATAPQQEAPRREVPPPPPPAAEPEAPPMPAQPALIEPAPEQGLQQMTSAPMKPRDEDPAASAEETASKRMRPKSARRAPPKITSNEVKVEKPRAGQEAAPSVAAGVILEGENEHEEESTIEMVDNTGEAVDTRSMLSEAGGQNHGRLVRNLLDAKEEMEAKGEEKEKGADTEVDPDKGGGIILGKKSKGGVGGGGGKLPSKSEVNSLRASIQTLCQSSNPLGRCLEYVQEDLEAMGKELESWRAQRNRRAGELADEEATTASALVGLKAELEQVEEKIKEKQAQIRFAKASILRNDAQVERLLSQVVRA